YQAINLAQSAVRETGNLPVPLHLRNAPTSLMKEMDYGRDYKYAHDFENNFVEDNYFPKELRKKKFWEPQNNASENRIKEWMRRLWKDRF
ncbi:MAG: replication-associated recombination protein A, partial [Dysgonamonadaceae bacterium]